MRSETQLRDHLYSAADSITLDPEGDLASAQRLGTRRRRTRRLGMASGAMTLVLVVIVGIGWATLRDDNPDLITDTRDPAPVPAPEVPAPEVPTPVEKPGEEGDETSPGDPAGVTQIILARRVRGLDLGHGAVWATQEGGDLIRINETSNEIEATISGDFVAAPVVDQSGVWVVAVDGTISRIDPNTNAITATVNTPLSPPQWALLNSQWLTRFDDSWWVIGSGDNFGRVDRIDPDTGSIEASLELGAAWSPQASGEGIWVVTSNPDAQGPERLSVVERIDPTTNEIAARVDVDDYIFDIDATNDAVWVMTSTKVVRIDPVTDTVAASYDIRLTDDEIRLNSMTATDTAVWVVPDTVDRFGGPSPARRIDIETGEVTALEGCCSYGHFWQVAANDQAIWTYSADTSVINRLDTS